MQDYQNLVILWLHCVHILYMYNGSPYPLKIAVNRDDLDLI